MSTLEKNNYFVSASDAVKALADQRFGGKAALIGPVSTPGEMEVTELPGDLSDWLRRLRLLEQVPFHYLVPDAELLPPESVRFFHLDKTWVDRLVEGAMSAGTVGGGDIELSAEVAKTIRDRLDLADGSHGAPITGMLLRSTLVRRWPRMEIRAYKMAANVDPRTIREAGQSLDGHRLDRLRIGRVSQGMLVALFRGVPNYVEIEEPKHGSQYGVNRNSQGQFYAEVYNRSGAPLQKTVPMEFKPVPSKLNEYRVLDIQALAGKLAGVLGKTADAVDVALAMQQLPFIQPFRDREVKAPAGYYPGNYYPDQPSETRRAALPMTIMLHIDPVLLMRPADVRLQDVVADAKNHLAEIIGGGK
jgi:hypothetical protein